MASEISRNDPCPCGSGLKYKRCCLGKRVPLRGKRLLWVLLLLCGALGLAVAVGLSYGLGRGVGTGAAALLLVAILLVSSRPPPSTGKRGQSSDINFGR